MLLAIRENPWCWLSGGISTSIFLVLFWQANLYMQSLLQAYYVSVSVYGWWNWRRGSAGSGPLPVQSWPFSRHAIIIGLILGLGLLSGMLLGIHTDSRLPYLDALTTSGGILTTWMAARKVLQNWLYWLFINAVAIYMYLGSELPLTAGLYGVYFVLAILGYAQWKRSYLNPSD